MPEQTTDRESETHEAWRAKREGDKASAAAAAARFQNFTAGGPAKAEDLNAPKRGDFPGGLGGEAAYQKARREYDAGKQVAALKKSSE